jgi:hypothetical protein
MSTPVGTITQIIYDVADAADGQKDNRVTGDNFQAVLNIFDRLDTKNPDKLLNIDALRGDSTISTNALGCLINYAAYEPEGHPSNADLGAISKLGAMGLALETLRDQAQINDYPQNQNISEDAIWAEAARKGVHKP